MPRTIPTDERFLVTAIGCGIAGFSYEQIAPLFMDVIIKKIRNVCLLEDFFLHIISIVGAGKD